MNNFSYAFINKDASGHCVHAGSNFLFCQSLIRRPIIAHFYEKS